MYKERRKEFEEKVEPLMLDDGMLEPLIRFGKELYAVTGVSKNTLRILKLLQCKALVEQNEQQVDEINNLDDMFKQMLFMKVFAFGLENKSKTSKEIEELSSATFGSYNKYRIANAMHNLGRDQEVLEIIEGFDKETLDKMTTLAFEVAGDLKVERDKTLMESRK
ncbi:hypothetical protein UT300012_22250 [Paraclostridium bifermentans]